MLHGADLAHLTGMHRVWYAIWPLCQYFVYRTKAHTELTIDQTYDLLVGADRTTSHSYAGVKLR